MGFLYLLLISLGLIVSYGTFIRLSRKWRIQYRLLKITKEKGLSSPYTIQNKFLGFERLYELISMPKDGDLLDIFASQMHLPIPLTRHFNPTGTSTLFTTSPTNIHSILVSDFNSYEFGEERRAMFKPLIGEAILTADGKDWARLRDMLKPVFRRERVDDLSLKGEFVNQLFRAIEVETQIRAKARGTNESGWDEADLEPMIGRFTIDLGTKFLFNESVNTQGEKNEERLKALKEKRPDPVTEQNFRSAIIEGTEVLAIRAALHPKLSWLVNPPRFKAAQAYIQGATSRYVSEALARPVPKAFSGPSEKIPGTEMPKHVSLLDHLVTETRNPLELRDQLLNIILAINVPMAGFLSWILLELARNPSDFDKIRKEILDAFPEKDPSKITAPKLRACKHLKNAILESTRLHPFVPINSRVVLKDTVLPTGGGADHTSPVPILAGETIQFSIYHLHRDTSIWGSDAEQWRPSRWEERKPGKEFVGFGAGPRVCIGQQYAINEGGYVIARFLMRYEKFEHLDEGKGLRQRVGITISPADGVKLRMKRAVQ